MTAAAACCGFSAGEYQGDLVKEWLKYRHAQVTAPGSGHIGHEEYTRCYAQVIDVLGDDRFKKLFPDSPAGDAVTWTAYRKQLFDELRRTHSADGNWSHDGWTARLAGPAYSLTVLQLDKGALPISQR